MSAQLDTTWSAVRMQAGPRRPNLVVVRTGSSSLHKQWPKELTEADRSWDLLLSHYAAAEPDCPDADIIVRQGAFKFSACHRLFDDIPWLRDYRAVWFCDDDIMTSWADIQRLFAVFHEFDLDLAQPSLTAESFASHLICVQQPDLLLRYTNFVEIMVPLFSAGALARCLPTFADAVTGWGLDLVWPKLLGYPRHKLAIIDDVAVRHTRPAASGPVYTEAKRMSVEPRGERTATLARYGVASSDPVTYGLMTAMPRSSAKPPSLSRRLLSWRRGLQRNGLRNSAKEGKPASRTETRGA